MKVDIDKEQIKNKVINFIKTDYDIEYEQHLVEDLLDKYISFFANNINELIVEAVQKTFEKNFLFLKK